MIGKTDTGGTIQLSKKNLIGYAMGDLGGCMTFALMGSFLTPYYTDVAGLSAGAIATMYLVLKIWDAINDPLMGALMDKAFARTHSHKGKFRPWMFRATPLLAIMAVLMFTAPTYTSGALKLVAATVTYLIYEASYTMFNIPYGSLLSAMAKNDAERASCSSARGFGSIIGNIIPMMLFPILLEAFKNAPETGYVTGVTVCAVIGLVACLLSCKWTVERNVDEPASEDASQNIKVTDILIVFRKNRAFDALCLMGICFCVQQYVVSTLGIYMYRDVLGALPMMSIMSLVSMGVGMLSLAVVPKFAEKFGLEKTIRVTQIVAATLYVVVFLLPTNVIIFLAGTALASGFAGVTVMMQWGLVGEAIDYNELVTGKRTEGSIYGVFNLMRRFGQAIGSSGSVLLLGAVGYVANATAQSAGTILGIKGLVLLVPAAAMVLCWVALRFVWNITPEIRAQINEGPAGPKDTDK